MSAVVVEGLFGALGAVWSRARLAVVGVVGGLAIVVLAPGGALAATLPGSSVPLAGSAFQGGDGSQADQSPFVDWQGLQAAGRVVDSPDPNGADSAFGGGTKEDQPGGWDLKSESGGVNPPKDNLLDAYSAVDQSGADTFLYLAFTREKADGSTFVAFELNQDARLWNNGRAKVPCRRTGDVLVVFEAQGKGMDVVLERWVTADTDAATGCATKGRLDQVASVPAADAQGAVNPGAIANYLPGAFAVPGQIRDAGQFGEAALNLSALLAAAFDERCFAFGSIWMHSRSSLSESSQLQDYLAPQPLTVRTCAAAGTKFYDLNANGRRDRGEPGIPRFLIWADYNGDGQRQANEPFAVTDVHGRYVIEDIRPPGGAYTLRETLPASRGLPATSWVCSYPNAGIPGGFANAPGGLFGCGWGPIATAGTAYAQGRDFGDWLPAQLTVRKRLWPADDPGRFDLLVNGTVVVAAAGNGASTTIPVPPGRYDITEAAVAATNAGAYRSTVECRPTTRRRGHLRAGTAYHRLLLVPGAHATCTFTNLGPIAGAFNLPTRAIAIEKTGPTIAIAGKPLRYTLYVTNPGDVPLPAATVKVSDPACDHPPALVNKAARLGTDRSPQTLDPGDTWTYQCSHTTTAPASDCTLSTITNTATATATANRTTVSDNDSITTTLACPRQPPQPPLPPPRPPGPPGPAPPTPIPSPGPTPPAPIAPPGPTPPPAGTIAAGLRAPPGCISRLSQIHLTGNRINHIQVKVDGQQVRQATLGILQQHASILPRLLRPGRHRVSVHITFQPGSGGPPLILTHTLTICRPPPPPKPPPPAGLGSVGGLG